MSVHGHSSGGRQHCPERPASSAGTTVYTCRSTEVRADLGEVDADGSRVLFACEGTSTSHEDGCDWQEVDARITSLGLERAAHEREVCRWLLEAERRGVPARLGFASVREYAERRLGLNGRQAEERLRVGRALERLPALDDALTTGGLTWSAVRELTRIAVVETETLWREWAEGKTSREVERAVASRQPGDLPTDRPDPTLIKHRLLFEIRAETMAVFRELQAEIREELAGDVDDDLLLYEIVRRATGGSDDGGRAPYQVSVSRCDVCHDLAIHAGGERHAVDAAVAEMIGCDAQEIGPVDLEDATSSSGDGPHVGGRKRATQTVAPRLRREVLRRGASCCAVPGCRNHRHLQLHHLVPRSEDGDHDPENLIGLCHRHHSAVHDGTLRIRGSVAEGMTFHHADGAAYGRRVEPSAVEIARLAFGALRQLGFKYTEANKLVDIVRLRGAPDSVKAFVAAALRVS